MSNTADDSVRDEGSTAPVAAPSLTQMVRVVVADPELDLCTAPYLKRQLVAAMTVELQLLIVDMSKVRFTGLAGLDALLSAYAQAGRREFEICLTGCESQFIRLLDRSGTVLPIQQHASAAATMQAFEER